MKKAAISNGPSDRKGNSLSRSNNFDSSRGR